ncbi:carbohydrate ABC transporter permease [Paenibacillus sp. MCAF20]
MGKKFGLSMRGRHILEGYSFISIWIIGFLLFMLYPLGVSLYYSFNNLEVTQHGLIATYAGFEHYRAAFATDIDFRPFLQSTVTTMLTQVPLILIFSMMSALLLNRQFRGRMLFRGIFFLPVIIASGAILRETLYSIVNSFTKPDNKIMDYINNIAFKSNNYAYGSAMGWIYFVVISIILAIVFFIFRRSLSASEGRR